MATAGGAGLVACAIWPRFACQIAPRRRFLRTLSGTLACWCALSSLHALKAIGQDGIDVRREYNVKAVSLYAFGRYVTWPPAAFPAADSPFVIGVFGDNPFGDALNQIAAKKTIGDRKITVRGIKAPEEAAGCHILFVTRTTTPETEAKLFEQVAGKPVLMVGESTGFAERGGAVNFFASGANVRFELNADKAVEAQLSLNAKLLTLGAKPTAQQ